KGFSLGGRHYGSGIGLPRNADAEYELKGGYEFFSASVGMDDGNNDQATAEFIVIGDGKELWRSGILKKADGAKSLKVNIAGVRRLILQVKAGPTGGGGDQCDWVNARLSK